MSLKNGENKICTVCNKEYYVVHSRAEKSKWCSSECWKQRRKLNDCEHCGNKIISYHGKKYCSRECSHAAMVGEKSARWLDGKSLERDRARLGTQLKEWRINVFKRDNYTCQHCGENKKLHAHHIIEWAKEESSRFDIDNGLTVCVICHGKIHGKDFTHRDKKKCPDCGKQINRQSKRCRECSNINQWKNRKDTAR